MSHLLLEGYGDQKRDRWIIGRQSLTLDIGFECLLLGIGVGLFRRKSWTSCQDFSDLLIGFEYSLFTVQQFPPQTLTVSSLQLFSLLSCQPSRSGYCAYC
jgi:hypothetical protein